MAKFMIEDRFVVQIDILAEEAVSQLVGTQREDIYMLQFHSEKRGGNKWHINMGIESK